MVLGYRDDLVVANDDSGYDVESDNNLQILPVYENPDDPDSPVTGWVVRSDDGYHTDEGDKWNSRRKVYETAQAALAAIMGPPPVDPDYVVDDHVFETAVWNVQPGSRVAATAEGWNLAGDIVDVLDKPDGWHWHWFASASDAGVWCQGGYHFAAPHTGNLVVLIEADEAAE